MIKQAIKNIVLIMMLDLVMLPFGIFLYLVVGFHIFHIILAMGYIYGLFKVYDTGVIFLKLLQEEQDKRNEAYFEGNEDDFDSDHVMDSIRYSDLSYRERGDEGSEPIKPEFKRALDEVFKIKK